jgi:hypothetical protein
LQQANIPRHRRGAPGTVPLICLFRKKERLIERGRRRQDMHVYLAKKGSNSLKEKNPEGEFQRITRRQLKNLCVLKVRCQRNMRAIVSSLKVVSLGKRHALV